MQGVQNQHMHLQIGRQLAAFLPLKLLLAQRKGLG
jgi:hypothetical protein